MLVPEAEKEKVGSSGGSQEGMAVLEDGYSSSMRSNGGGREETLLFFEDDVLKAGCSCSSE